MKKVNKSDSSNLFAHGDTSFDPDLLSGYDLGHIDQRQRLNQVLAQMIIDSTSDFMWCVDPQDFGLLAFNKGLSDYFLNEIGIHIAIGMRPEDLFPPGAYVAKWHAFYAKALSQGTYSEDYSVYSGSRFLQLTFNLIQDRGKVVGISVFGKDDTKRKLALDALQDNEEKFRMAFMTGLDAIYIATLEEGLILEVNGVFEDVFGYPREEVIGRTSLELGLYAFPEDRKKVVEILKHSGFVRDLELAGRKKGGTLIRVSLSIHVMVLKGKKHILGVIRDITAQKQTEKALLEASKQYQEIVEGAIEGIYRTTLDGRTVSANRAFASMLGYESAREVLDTVTDWGTQVWVDSSERRSFLERLSASKAIQGYECQFKRKRGEVIWVSINSRMVYDESGHALYAEGFIQEITNRKQAEAERQRFEEQLKQTLESTTSALSMAIEMRDPYTAGHQRRVADLACRMWNRLGYSSESCEGLRIAALLHDLGKLRIPTDILTKPTVLSKAELALINEHALAGWDILRFVEFPWPVATIVRQHHERLDGSGYPDGLRGSEILKESSVLAVADVVEAMASHRPYRSTLGLDAALVEISNGSGSLYSPEAVQACIALFREDGYWLPD